MCVEQFINIISDAFTIAGVIFATFVYFLWKNDYSLQKSHEYALHLLKKIKYLHLEIESMRSPRLHNPATISNDIEKIYIPMIEDKIIKKIVEIQVDLLIAKESLRNHKDLQSKFNAIIIEQVIHPIQSAKYEFISLVKKQTSFEIENTKLWEFFFPSQNAEIPHKIKRSVLGTNVEIIDDEFNKKIESCFNIIYDYLEANLVVIAKN